MPHLARAYDAPRHLLADGPTGHLLLPFLKTGGGYAHSYNAQIPDMRIGEPFYASDSYAYPENEPTPAEIFSSATPTWSGPGYSYSMYLDMQLSVPYYDIHHTMRYWLFECQGCSAVRLKHSDGTYPVSLVSGVSVLVSNYTRRNFHSALYVGWKLNHPLPLPDQLPTRFVTSADLGGMDGFIEINGNGTYPLISRAYAMNPVFFMLLGAPLEIDVPQLTDFSAGAESSYFHANFKIEGSVVGWR